MSQRTKNIIKIALIILGVAAVIATAYILLSNKEKTVETAKKFAEKCKEKKEKLLCKFQKCTSED